LQEGLASYPFADYSEVENIFQKPIQSLVDRRGNIGGQLIGGELANLFSLNRRFSIAHNDHGLLPWRTSNLQNFWAERLRFH
jgi:hypothetical protein